MEEITIKGTVKYDQENDSWHIQDEKGNIKHAGHLLDGIDLLNWDFRTQHGDIVEITVRRNTSN